MTKHKITVTDTAALDRIVNAPVFFERNRVFRNYIGGEGFRALMGDPTGDNSFPEEWLASKVKAINPVYFGERDGTASRWWKGRTSSSTTCSLCAPRKCWAG